MNSSQDIDSVTLAAEIVKVMNAKIVAKINQEGSDIQRNRTVIQYKLYCITYTRKIHVDLIIICARILSDLRILFIQSEPFLRLSCQGSRRMQSKNHPKSMYQSLYGHRL